MKPTMTKMAGTSASLSIRAKTSSSNFVVKNATVNVMNAPAPIEANVVNKARGSSWNAAAMLHHLQDIRDLRSSVGLLLHSRAFLQV